MMLPIISVLVGISLMYYIRQKRVEKEMDEIVNSISPSNDSNENIGTRDLCLELLRQLNCEVRIEHDDIYFTYQNEKFMIEASNESAFITIWDLHWDMVDSENIQNVENMKKAVNRTNHLVHNTVLYMSYEEEKSYYILSKLQCLLMHNIPNTKAYLAAILNDFFRTKQCYSQVLDDIGKEGGVDINAVVAGIILLKKNQSLEEWTIFSAKKYGKVDFFDIFVYSKIKLCYKIELCLPNKAVLCVKVLSL